MNLTRRDFLFSAAAAPSAAAPARRPNIVFIVSDDHGYGDVSCYPHPREVSTPNIDRIARRGIRFEQGYANCYVCAPTRAALLTGRYPQRYGFYTASDSRAGLPLSETTLAGVLKQAGYATGAFGKWHLGIQPPYHPMKRGFDEFYGFLGHGGHDYFDLKPTGEIFTSILRGYDPIEETGYLTDNIGREALSFVARNGHRPFFLYLAFNAVHFPMQAPRELIRKYDTGKPDRDILMAMLEAEDRAIGRLLDELDRRRLSGDTLLFFISDNGGARANSSNNGALRDYKASVYEGGIRVPFLVSWPGRLPENTVSREPVMSMDLMPTAAAAAGAPLPREIEGRDMLPVLTGASSGPLHQALFWDASEGRTAVRSGPWKLVANNGRTELFNLEEDLSEKRDLSAQRPETVTRLRGLFEDWSRRNLPRIRKGGEEGKGASGRREGRKRAKKSGL
ncbi:MAG: sulfatase-like hydrolase/transferase [Bryobacteraceae bacterium]